MFQDIVILEIAGRFWAYSPHSAGPPINGKKCYKIFNDEQDAVDWIFSLGEIEENG